ncbi:HRSL1 enzyme, partial [Spelaeornis formosus]|nr:HRSL1 enzyme [Elachura formosa]
MSIPDMTDDEHYPNPGDLIEVKRGPYEHWALYMGDGYVIHVKPVDVNSPPVSAGSVTLVTRKAKVKKELLVEVAANNDWDVNNKYDCHRTPFPMDEIIRRAEPWIGREVPYLLFRGNCEHFVTKLRYGEGVSEQVS